jgi:hypothetical protein
MSASMASCFPLTCVSSRIYAKPAASDDLAVAIDYGKVVSVMEKIFCGKPRHLVEAAALNFAQALLDGFPRIESVTVKVTKLAQGSKSATLTQKPRLRAEMVDNSTDVIRLRRCSAEPVG